MKFSRLNGIVSELRILPPVGIVTTVLRLSLHVECKSVMYVSLAFLETLNEF